MLLDNMKITLCCIFYYLYYLLFICIYYRDTFTAGLDWTKLLLIIISIITKAFFH